MAMPATTKRWTLEEVHSLPDDGNKYELIHGELYVTPPPSPEHDTTIARLNALLIPYVIRHELGLVYHPRSVIRWRGSEVEPDLMVRQEATGLGNAWEKAPLPLLIVEVFSPTTRRRDQVQKHDFYMDAGIPEYWMIDPEQRVVSVVRAGGERNTVSDTLLWRVPNVSEALTIPLGEIFGP